MNRSYSNISSFLEVVRLSVLHFHLPDELHIICVIIVKWNILVWTLYEHELFSSKWAIKASNNFVMDVLANGASVATKC